MTVAAELMFLSTGDEGGNINLYLCLRWILVGAQGNRNSLCKNITIPCLHGDVNRCRIRIPRSLLARDLQTEQVMLRYWRTNVVRNPRINHQCCFIISIGGGNRTVDAPRDDGFISRPTAEFEEWMRGVGWGVLPAGFDEGCEWGVFRAVCFPWWYVSDGL